LVKEQAIAQSQIIKAPGIFRHDMSIDSNTQQELQEPADKDSNFGRKSYWNDFYEKESDFRWYSDWTDIEPFFNELVPCERSDRKGGGQQQLKTRVLLPGIGNDASMVDMYDFGYRHMSAFDYAEAGIACAKDFFGERVLPPPNDCTEDESMSFRLLGEDGVDLRVADARTLPYADDSFDAALEKGALDAIYLSGASNKELASTYLDMTVKELARVICEGGIVMSITAACADAVRESFSNSDWEVIRDGEFYVSSDGFTSNNVDATIFAWKRNSK